MKKLALLLSFGVTVNAFALDGYWSTLYGDVLKDGYGECVHTAYYDLSDGIAQCGEAPIAQKPATSMMKINDTSSGNSSDTSGVSSNDTTNSASDNAQPQ